jgi:hypothetical protein
LIFVSFPSNTTSFDTVECGLDAFVTLAGISQVSSHSLNLLVNDDSITTRRSSDVFITLDFKTFLLLVNSETEDYDHKTEKTTAPFSECRYPYLSKSPYKSEWLHNFYADLWPPER